MNPLLKTKKSKINKKLQLNWLLKSLSLRDLKKIYGCYEFSQQLTECCHQLPGVCQVLLDHFLNESEASQCRSWWHGPGVTSAKIYMLCLASLLSQWLRLMPKVKEEEKDSWSWWAWENNGMLEEQCQFKWWEVRNYAFLKRLSQLEPGTRAARDRWR